MIRGYKVPKDSAVISNLWGVLHDPEVWPDPDVFKPERFIDDAGRVKVPKEWIPFSTGSKNSTILIFNWNEIVTYR